MSPSQTKLYKSVDLYTNEVYLVQAATKAKAHKYMTESRFETELASTDDIVAYNAKGKKIYSAEEPKPQEEASASSTQETKQYL